MGISHCLTPVCQLGYARGLPDVFDRLRRLSKNIYFNKEDKPSVPALIVSVLALVLCQLTGEFVVRALGIPLPGALIGLVLLTIALIVLGRVPQALAKVSGGLLRNMMLLLAPAVVGLIDNMARVREEWLPFLVACVAGAVITLAVTAVVLQRLLKNSPSSDESAAGGKA